MELAEDVSSAASSASGYDLREDVGILPVVMTEREFCQVQRQILFADVVIRADDATLQQTPKAFQIIV